MNAGCIYEQRRNNYTEELRPYLDSDFDSKFDNPEYRSSCESELILGHEILQKEYILKKRGSDEGPDYLVEHNGNRVWIEVVTPREGDYPRHEKIEILGDAESGVVNSDNCKLKISSVLKDKKDQFRKCLEKGVVSQNDLKIICVNTKKLNGGNRRCPFIVSVLYGIEEIWWVGNKSHGIDNEFIKQKPVIKPTGSRIDMGLFAQDEYSDIDAVLWFDYALGTIAPGICEVQFFANHNRKDKVGDLFACWHRVFCENGILTK